MAEKENSQTDNRLATFTPENSEIEALQDDIGTLIDNIHQFISTQPNHSAFHPELYEYNNDGNTSEKDDGPPEKCTGKELEIASASGISIASSDSEAESEQDGEIDWSVAGPVLQKHISDLERLHSLNTTTSSLIRRMKKLTLQKSMKQLQNELPEEKALTEALEF